MVRSSKCSQPKHTKKHLFESVWKLIRLSVVAPPKLMADDMDPATREVNAVKWPA